MEHWNFIDFLQVSRVVVVPVKFCVLEIRFRPKIVQKCQTRIFRLKIGISGINIGKFFKIKSEIRFWKWTFQIFEIFVLKWHFKIENSNLWSLNRELIFKKEFSNLSNFFLESILAFFGIYWHFLNSEFFPSFRSFSFEEFLNFIRKFGKFPNEYFQSLRDLVEREASFTDDATQLTYTRKEALPAGSRIRTHAHRRKNRRLNQLSSPIASLKIFSAGKFK